MRQSISFILVIMCTLVLATKESHAKKGCNAYGHACYGGHGKRSLVEEEVRPNTIAEIFPIPEVNPINSYPRYRLIRILTQLLSEQPRRILTDRLNDFDYPENSNEPLRDIAIN